MVLQNWKQQCPLPSRRWGQITARVLFDGTHGLEVNKRTRVRDQERAPIAADSKRSMRAKAARGEATFVVTADVSEAHRQAPTHPQDWRLLGCQVHPGGDVFINTVRTFGVSSPSLLLVPDLQSPRKAGSVHGRKYGHDVAHAGCGRLPVGVWRETVPVRCHVLLYSCSCIGCPCLDTKFSEDTRWCGSALSCYWNLTRLAYLKGERNGLPPLCI